MSLNEYTKIEQSSNTREVNMLLDKGFEIFKVAQSRLKTPEVEQVNIQYCLGFKGRKRGAKK